MTKLLKYILILLFLIFLSSCSAQTVFTAQQVTIVSYNVESDDIKDTNPLLVSDDIRLIKSADIWGLSEVQNESDAEIFRQGIARKSANYNSILGKTGGSDQLQIVFNSRRLKLINSKELPGFGGTRFPLVVQFEFIPNGQQFLFTLNHFNRGSAEKRELQAENLRQWAKAQKLPVIAVGDYNFDVSTKTKTGNKAFEIFMSDNTFTWVEPLCLSNGTCPKTGTQCNSRYNSILDFVFLGGKAQQWQGESQILFQDLPVCEKESKGYSDHYPIAAQITISPLN